MKKNEYPDFSNKVVILYLANSPRALADGIALESPSFKTIGEIVYLVGHHPTGSEGNNWLSNLEGGVIWSSVVHYLVIDSTEEYLQRIGKIKPTLLQKILG
jgi:hypothetical protein